MAIDLSGLPDKHPVDLSQLPDKAAQASQDSTEPTFLHSLNKVSGEAAKAALYPLTFVSAPIAEIAKNEVAPPPLTPEQAHAQGQQATGENPSTYERSSNYPPSDITSGGPSLDVALAGSGAKDIFNLGASALAKQASKKAALEAFIADSKKPLEEGIPTEPIIASPITELTHATSNKAANSIMKSGFDMSKAGSGADATQDVKGFMGQGVSMAKNPEVAKANVADTFAKRETSLVKSYLPQKDILTITKESHPEQYDALINPDPTVSQPVAQSIVDEAKQQGFKAVSFPDGETLVVDTKASRLLENKPLVDTSKQLEFPNQAQSSGITFNTRQTNELEKALGSPIPKVQEGFGVAKRGASTDISPTGILVPKTEQAKAIDRATNDIMKEPITPEPTLPTTKALLPGAKDRIKAFSDIPSSPIDARNPLTSRAELNKKVGKLEKTATDQWLAGVSAENQAVENGLKDKTGLRKVTNIKPDSLESQALFHFIENPSKMQAYGQLASTAGKDTADQIAKAEFYMRGKLDSILPEINKVREVNGLQPIAYRGDYITHMNEMNILTSLNKLDILGTKEGGELANSVANADTKLASNPNLYSKLQEVVFPYVQRKNEEHATDAISAFDRYIDNAHRYIQTQPYVNELASSASAVASKNPGLADYLRQQANWIAGGRSPIDKGVELVVNKDLLRIASQLQNNAKGNVITLNPSVPLTQLFGLTSTVGKYPLRDSLMASMQSFADPALQKYALANSPVLQSRALNVQSNALTGGKITNASSALISWFDYKVAEISWMSAFKNAIKTKPLDEALNDANEWAAITQSHQGRVSISPIMQSQTIQTLLPLMNQQVAAARSLLLNTFQGKSLTGKAWAAAKMTAFGAAISALKDAVTGKPDNPLSPTNVIPFGGVLERGAGGPVFNSLATLSKSANQEQVIRNLIRTGFLLQNKIPGGVIVGKAVENALMGAPKKGKK